MKTITFVIALLFLNICLPQSLHTKYPDGLLTEDFGILNEADLLKEIKNGNPRPYNTKEMQSGYNRWQCFPLKDVKFKIEKWRAPDPMGQFDVIVNMCDFSFDVRQKNQINLYHDRRARR